MAVEISDGRCACREVAHSCMSFSARVHRGRQKEIERKRDRDRQTERETEREREREKMRE